MRVAALIFCASLAVLGCDSATDPTEQDGGDAVYEGTYSGTLVQTTTVETGSPPARTDCTNTYALNGTLQLNLFANADPSGALGSFSTVGTENETAVNGPAICPRTGNRTTSFSGPITGTLTQLVAADSSVNVSGVDLVTFFGAEKSSGEITERSRSRIE